MHSLIATLNTLRIKPVFLLPVFVCFLSCNKNKDNTHVAEDPNLPAGTIQYKHNDTTLTIHQGDRKNYDNNEVQTASVTKSEDRNGIPTHYTWSGVGFQHTSMSLAIFTDSLMPGTYTFDASDTKPAGFGFISIFQYAGQFSSFEGNADYIKVTISSNYGDKVSGTFEARLTPYPDTTNASVPPVTYIREGKFRDVQLLY